MSPSHSTREWLAAAALAASTVATGWGLAVVADGSLSAGMALAGGVAVLVAAAVFLAWRASGDRTGRSADGSIDDCQRSLVAALEDFPACVLLTDGNRLLAANARSRALLGPGVEAPEQLFPDPESARKVLAADAPVDADVQLQLPAGSCIRAHVMARTLFPAPHGTRLVVASDQSERDDINARLDRQREDLQAMTRRLMTLQEDERSALSRELHDDIGQAITAIKLCATALADEDAAQRAEAIAEIADTADQTIVKLRNLSMLLRPPQLDALGLEAALRWQAGAMFRKQHARLDLALSPLPTRPDPAVELACFRIAQEAMTNALRHSEAAEVRLTLAAEDKSIVITIHDDGRGFDLADGHNLGLLTMRERAQQLGGTLAIETARGAGTRVRAHLPMQGTLDSPGQPH